MKCTLHFLLLNDDYSNEHAEASGKEESAINRKYEWRDELEITSDVTDVIEAEDKSYFLRGQFEDGEEFSYEIPNMHLLELQGDSPLLIGCSNALFDSVSIDKGDEITVNITLKDYEPLTNPVPGIYISTTDFPQELAI